MSKNVRVRLAPSPTGEVHIGTLWLAQFDWLYARQHGGTFVLRVEDTDQKRLVAGSIDRLYETLEWIGLKPDEGPREGGKFGPYVQSERLDLYQKYANQLVADGRAYHCFCTAERLTELRAAQSAAKQPPRYDRQCRDLSTAEVKERLARGETSVIRMKLPTAGQITHHDLIRGDVTFAWDQLDDSVIMKSDGFPTYHLAVVVDDHLMEITHVFRAEEWLPSVPKHLFLYQALGWTPPAFAHFPLILGTDKTKLSKRHGATSASAYREEGFLPEALRNFLILMGWHPKGDSEIITPDEAIKQFSLEDMSSSGAVFDRTKLEWLNGWYIRHLADDELRQRLQGFWNLPIELQSDTAWQLKALAMVKDRLRTLRDINELTSFLIPAFWDEQLQALDQKLVIPKKGSLEKTIDALHWMHDQLALNDTWRSDLLKEGIIAKIAEAERKNLDVLWPTRVALSLRAASPDVFDIMAGLGRDETLRRLDAVLQRLAG